MRTKGELVDSRKGGRLVVDIDFDTFHGRVGLWQDFEGHRRRPERKDTFSSATPYRAWGGGALVLRVRRDLVESPAERLAR